MCAKRKFQQHNLCLSFMFSGVPPSWPLPQNLSRHTPHRSSRKLVGFVYDQREKDHSICKISNCTSRPQLLVLISFRFSIFQIANKQDTFLKKLLNLPYRLTFHVETTFCSNGNNNCTSVGCITQCISTNAICFICG